MNEKKHSVRDVVLAIAAYGKGHEIKGRTLLQKLVYFLNELLKLEIRYSPAYYGPYSEDVAKATNSLVALGFLKETETLYPIVSDSVFPVCKYTYKMTEEGKIVFELMETDDKEYFLDMKSAIEKIYSYGDIDYVDLSIAAKMAHILKSSAPNPMRQSEIIEAAKELKWKLSDAAIEKAAHFLLSLDVIRESGKAS